MSEQLDDDFAAFWDDLDLEVETTGELSPSAFFGLFSRVASGNGDCADLEYTPVLKDGRNAYQIDGYAVDLDRNELHVAVSDFRQSRSRETLNSRELESLFQRLSNFIENAADTHFVSALEEESFAFQAAYPIFQNRHRIRRIRMIVLSNALLATRSKPEASGEVLGIPVVRNVLDFRRYAEIMRSLGAPEPIEIDIEDLNGAPLPCLAAHGSSGTYEAYLVALPGELLANIYGLYSARLLEQNVRSFLQAKTKVNQGIIETIQNYPGMFFAYNNGLTATASGIETVEMGGGGLAIRRIRNLQIVNGGQTTASILYAKDSPKGAAELSEVYVQMKLSVIEPELVDEVVPDISRYANTQNKVSEADFFSNHPFHIEMEKLSRRCIAPPKLGSISGSKWFYERARGQYRYGKAYGTAATRNRFEVEFPRDQVISKTEAAKYWLTFEANPWLVSRGETKYFIEFAEEIGSAWNAIPDDFNETFFKELVAKAIIFRGLDKLIGQASWYKEDRGYKAQNVTYAIAWLAEHLLKSGRELNLQLVWREQKLPEELESALGEIAQQVALTLRDAPSTVKNIGEYCKQKICWETVRKTDYRYRSDIEAITIARDEARDLNREARRQKQADNDIEFDILITHLPPAVPEIIAFSQRQRLLSPKSNAALEKLGRGRVSISVSERNALKNLFSRLQKAGFSFSRYLPDNR